MAESTDHHGLVIRAVNSIRDAVGREPILQLMVDPPEPNGSAPPTIDGHRPDVYAITSHLIIVGEAKPPWDVETPRTARQLSSFIRFVEADPSRHLLLAVNWVSSATALSVSKGLAQDWPAIRDRVHIADGLRSLILPTYRQGYVTA